MSKYCLGKLPARHDPRVPTLHSLLGGVLLPPAPAACHWNSAVKTYGMLANDQMGDCVVAAGFHQLQTWSANNGAEIVPDEPTAVMVYSELSGYDPVTHAHDTGLEIHTFLQDWVTTGFPVKQGGGNLRLGGYAALDPHDVATMRSCIYWFGGVMVGIALPADAETAFTDGQPWDKIGAAAIGGHCIEMIGYDPDYLYAITWGRVQAISPAWWLQYGDEAYPLCGQKWLTSDRTPSGLDLAQMNSELAALRARLGEG